MHEKEEMRLHLEAEMTELKANIARMKIIEKRAQASRNEPSSEVKSKLQKKFRAAGDFQDLSQENQALKSKLAESHLELAIIKSELATVRADYESKKEEMISDSNALIKSAQQTQNLQRQIQLL
ncbi:unnamed protein product [Gongylonema pulchrum]|uniref:Uncharacterized protein n=1 Tax=Gongylonema pulchrum TaxID=637853 RepID=A0A3P6S460_9BILA|nr:unnamed protein product [Gongylonema pulchrum]